MVHMLSYHGLDPTSQVLKKKFKTWEVTAY